MEQPPPLLSASVQGEPLDGSIPAAPTYRGRVAWRTMTLHEAIAQVLREHGNEWMTAKDIAAEINQRRLYWKRDGSPVGLNQIHARTNNYQALFERHASRIRLRQPDGDVA